MVVVQTLGALASVRVALDELSQGIGGEMLADAQLSLADALRVLPVDSGRLLLEVQDEPHLNAWIRDCDLVTQIGGLRDRSSDVWMGVAVEDAPHAVEGRRSAPRQGSVEPLRVTHDGQRVGVSMLERGRPPYVVRVRRPRLQRCALCRLAPSHRRVAAGRSGSRRPCHARSCSGMVDRVSRSVVPALRVSSWNVDWAGRGTRGARIGAAIASFDVMSQS